MGCGGVDPSALCLRSVRGQSPSRPPRLRGCAPQPTGYVLLVVIITFFQLVSNIAPVTFYVFVIKGEPESPSFRRTAAPAHRRHMRTIQEVRTTVTRIITDVYYEDGKEVDRKVTEVPNIFLISNVFTCTV